jgi:hypothetical protein
VGLEFSGFVGLSAMCGQPEHAIRLGSVIARVRDLIGAVFAPLIVKTVLTTLGRERPALSTEGPAAWAAGRAMPLAQAIAYALEADA